MTTSTMGMLRLLILLTSFAAFAEALTAPSASRRAFLVKAPTTVALVSSPPPVQAYGEFEPGAKERKKAAQESKKTTYTTSSAPSSKPSVQSDDLKGALGDLSYTSSTKK